MRTKTLLIVAIISSLLISCSSQKALFENASNIDTIESYKEFLQKYPNSQYSLSAMKKLAKLSFAEVKKENTISAYYNYINEFPNSDSINVAMHNLSYLRTKEENTIYAYEEFLKYFPNSKYKKEINDDIKFDKAKKDYYNNIKIQKLEEYLAEYPKGKNVKMAQKLINEFQQLDSTIVSTEDIHLLENFLSRTTYSDFSKQGRIILEGQKALLSGYLDNLDFEKINKSNSNYGKELVEIVLAIRSSSTPNILVEANNYAAQGNTGLTQVHQTISKTG